jgi:hypothetical protein
MKPYMIVYRRKSIKGTLSRIVKANNQDEAIYALKLKFDPDGTENLSVKDVHLLDKALSEPFVTRHTDATSSLALHDQAYQRYRLINRHPGKGGII